MALSCERTAFCRQSVNAYVSEAVRVIIDTTQVIRQELIEMLQLRCKNYSSNIEIGGISWYNCYNKYNVHKKGHNLLYNVVGK